MKAKGVGIATVVLAIGVIVYKLGIWQADERQKQAAVCHAAQQNVQVLEKQARAMAAGLSVEGYAQAETAEVEKLVRDLDAAANKDEINAVIKAHSAAVEARVAAIDAEVEARGGQLFLEQQRKEQRITVDVQQEITRAIKARNAACY